MATNWTYPNQISQYSEEGAEEQHISWSNLGVEAITVNDKLNLVTTKNLYHIARSPKHDLTTKTYFLQVSNFKFQNLPATISGIELRLSVNRRGRISDDVVQLMLDNVPIGDNKAGVEITQNKIYGSPTDMWNTSLTNEDLQKSHFGILMRFKSHPKWPHSDPMFVNSVELRIY